MSRVEWLASGVEWLAVSGVERQLVEFRWMRCAYPLCLPRMLEILSTNRSLERIIEEEQKMLSQVDQTRLPSFRIGMEQGLQQGFQQGFVLGFLLGFQQGQLQLLKRQIQRRFGPITTVQQARLEQLDRDYLVRLGEDMLDFTRIEDLDDWFGRH